MGKLLTPELLAHIGRTAPPKTEVVTRRDIRKYAVATGQRQRRYLDGEIAPPLFYMTLFWEVVELDQLTPDGVYIDRLIPELPLKRAMAGGLKVEYARDIFPGDVLTATRTLTDLYEKQGSSGPLIFYEVVMDVRNADGEPVLTETATRILR
ncbi:MAG: hypothetical protein D6727_08055 [Gammaproteobacteria bacterium]|nr:MAG: hypothetical protein D6727_08055 [Gammaproteobacteria bacterium]